MGLEYGRLHTYTHTHTHLIFMIWSRRSGRRLIREWKCESKRRQRERERLKVVKRLFITNVILTFIGMSETESGARQSGEFSSADTD